MGKGDFTAENKENAKSAERGGKKSEIGNAEIEKPRIFANCFRLRAFPLSDFSSNFSG
jgi:hypothetical protein